MRATLVRAIALLVALSHVRAFLAPACLAGQRRPIVMSTRRVGRCPVGKLSMMSGTEAGKGPAQSYSDAAFMVAPVEVGHSFVCCVCMEMG